MAPVELIVYNVAAFICALFVLEFGADQFIDHTTIVADRTGIPQGIIALLTAGAEWEELAVVAISIARHRSSLAVGNIVGSTISNILGAFSLGLLFHRSEDGELFDRSSKIYSALLLVQTTLVAGLTGFAHAIRWRVVGVFAIVLFVIYAISIAWTIYKGLVAAPEGSDSESSDGESDDTDEERHEIAVTTTNSGGLPPTSGGIDGRPTTGNGQLESSPLLARIDTDTSDETRGPYKHSLAYHFALQTVGILAVILSAYVLSHSASTLVNNTGLSDVAFGVVILSLATTVPEKFIAIVSGFRGQMGIMVANTVGSNIFLLTLCMGVLWVSTGGDYDHGSVRPAEIGVMFGSAVVMNLTVWFGSKWARWIGAGMLAAYVAFLVLEFTVIHPV